MLGLIIKSALIICGFSFLMNYLPLLIICENEVLNGLARPLDNGLVGFDHWIISLEQIRRKVVLDC